MGPKGGSGEAETELGSKYGTGWGLETRSRDGVSGTLQEEQCSVEVIVGSEVRAGAELHKGKGPREWLMPKSDSLLGPGASAVGGAGDAVVH